MLHEPQADAPADAPPLLLIHGFDSGCNFPITSALLRRGPRPPHAALEQRPELDPRPRTPVAYNPSEPKHGPDQSRRWVVDGRLPRAPFIKAIEETETKPWT